MYGFPEKLNDKTDIKIFILYLMENLTVPLRYSELNDMAVTDGVVCCIAFAECFAELVDTGNVRPYVSRARSAGDAMTPEERAAEEAMAKYTAAGGKEAPPPEMLFEITPKGRHAATELQSKLLWDIRDRSLKSALRCLRFSREGGGIRTEKTPRGDGRYDVTCVALDGKGDETLRVQLIADSDRRAEQIRDTFNDRPEHIYRAIFALLTGKADFLFDQ